MERFTTNRGIKIALFGYVALVALQLVAYFMSGALVVLAIAFETLASILIAVFLLFAAHYSRKPADDIHMLGYERAQNVAAVIVAVVFITLLSFETFRQAISKFFVPHSIQLQNIPLALAVSGVSVLIATIPLIDILRTKGRGAALKTQLISSIEDVIAYSSGIIGLVLVGRGYYIADPIASMIVGAFIAFAGFYLIKDNIRYLMGKGPGLEYLQDVESKVMLVKGVRGVRKLKAEYVGPDNLFIGFYVQVAKGTPIEEAENIVQEIKSRVGGETGCQHCVIELEAEDD